MIAALQDENERESILNSQFPQQTQDSQKSIHLLKMIHRSVLRPAGASRAALGDHQAAACVHSAVSAHLRLDELFEERLSLELDPAHVLEEEKVLLLSAVLLGDVRRDARDDGHPQRLQLLGDATREVREQDVQVVGKDQQVAHYLDVAGGGGERKRRSCGGRGRAHRSFSLLRSILLLLGGCSCSCSHSHSARPGAADEFCLRQRRRGAHRGRRRRVVLLDGALSTCR
mmetsp:Transcript_24534/g.61770  ORF Transcript_24534/g.61770 Transcript_24534/m.61770 type:complete len:229 (-) Transcript_24534:1189-1875(-)